MLNFFKFTFCEFFRFVAVAGAAKRGDPEPLKGGRLLQYCR